MTKRPAGAERELRIVYMRLDKIKRDPDNPKDHDLGALAESFKRFGFVAPVAINEATGMLLLGHGRLDELERAKIAGDDPPAGIKVTIKDGMWRAPVIRGITLSDTDGKAYLIADNRLVELGGWHDPELVKRLMEVGGSEPAEGLKGVGFDGDDLDALISLVGGETDWFDAGKLPDAPTVPGADTKAYVIAVVYISFEEEATFDRGLEALTFGERTVQRKESKYAQIDGETYLERWEAAAKREVAN